MFGFFSNAERERRKAIAVLESMMDQDWVCSGCSNVHSGLSELCAAAPDPWPHGETYSENGELWDWLDRDFLSEDFCVIDGENFMVRGVMPMPVIGMPGKWWAYGVWSTLSRDNFDRYLNEFDSGRSVDDGARWFGWFCNRIPGFEAAFMKPCWVVPQMNRQRPLILPQEGVFSKGERPDDGIEPELLLSMLRKSGHSL